MTGLGYDQYAFVADLYDHVGAYATRGDVAFYVDAAERAGGPVLEIGCGTGRVLIPCARAGARMVGLDRSPHMLRICRARLEEEPDAVRSRVRTVEGDMRDFDLGETFALATLPFRCFQHLLTVEDQVACLGRVHDHLDPGGRVILDVFNPAIDVLANRKEGVEFAAEPEFKTPDGRRVVRRHTIASHDRFNQINQVELAYCVTHPDGREERLIHAFGMRYLYRFEAEHLLARCGFEVERVYSGYDGGEYGSVYPGELVFVGRVRR
jgi:SAM-dependent methyltransferase